MLRRFAVFGSVVTSLVVAALIGPSGALAQTNLTINLESVPPGAHVLLDSATGRDLGATPLRRIAVPRGQHTFIFRLEGYEDAQVSANLTRSGSTVRAQLSALSRLTLSASNDGAQGATVSVQGESWGALPVNRWVRPGRYLVIVNRDGYQPFQQWVDLSPGQALALPVQLERIAARTGSISVVADAEGVPVFLDGQQRGTSPCLIEDVPEGDHVLEIRPTGDNVRALTQTVRVAAGRTAQVTPQVRIAVAPSVGSVRIFSTTPGAIISLDGEVLGGSPQTKEVPAGEHIVQVTADGYQSTTQTVVVVAGQQKVVQINLEAVARAAGRIQINSSVDGATVIVDGQDRGSPPVVISDAPAGTHAIIVRAPGRRELRQTCETGPGRDCTLNAELDAVRARVRVQAQAGVSGDLFVDGANVGRVPWDGQLTLGQHLVEIRADGYRTYTSTLDIAESSEVRIVEAQLVGANQRTAEEQQAAAAARAREIERAFIHTADVLPTELAVVDVFGGWPYLGGARLSVGISRFIDAGVGFRSFGRLNEFEGRVHMGHRFQRLISLGGQVRIGGGVGPTRQAGGEDHKTNSFFLSAEGLATLHFSHAAAFTLVAAFDFSSDRWDYEGSNNDVLVSPLERQNLARARFGAVLDFAITSKNALFFRFEGAVGDDRRIYGDLFGGGRNDSRLYGEFGFTHKFDAR